MTWWTLNRTVRTGLRLGGDARAIARGTYGRRVIRRQQFRLLVRLLRGLR